MQNEDAKAIDTALLAFLSRKDLDEYREERGEFIALNPYYDKNRPTFAELMELHYNTCARDATKRSKLPGFLDILNDARKQSSKSSLPVLDLEKLALDERIVATKTPRTPFSDPVVISDRWGHRGSVRAFLSVEPSAYSSNGKYAIVKVGAPWSMHGADITILMERIQDRWEIVDIESMIFL